MRKEAECDLHFKKIKKIKKKKNEIKIKIKCK